MSMELDSKFDIFLPIKEVKRKFRKRRETFTIEVGLGQVSSSS